MFDAADSLATWLGLALAGSAFLGAALAVPTAPPPNAAAIAETVDVIAASEHDATGTVTLHADSVRLTSDGVTVRSDGGAATAAFLTRVTPVSRASRLGTVLRGGDPADVFRTPTAFARAAERAREGTPVRASVGPLRVRHVTWRGVDVVLVG